MSIQTLYSNGGTYGYYANTFPAASYDIGTNRSWHFHEAWNPGLARREVKVQTLNPTTGVSSAEFLVALAVLTNDAHGVPSGCPDADGRWHCFHGAHISTLHHSVTTNPNDPSTWTALANISIGDGVTYPHPVLVGSTIYLFLRGQDTAATSGPLVMISSASITNGVVVWNDPITIADFGADTKYYQSPTLLRGGKIYWAAARANQAVTTLEDVYAYVYDTADGSLKNYNESVSTAAVDLPVDLTTQNDSYRIYTQTPGNLGSVPSICFDSLGGQHFVYSDGVPDSGVFDVFHRALIGGVLTDQFTLGVQPHFADQPGIIPGDLGAVSAYWVQDAGFASVGGDMWTRARAPGFAGAWGSSSLYRAAGAKALAEPVQILHGPANLRFMFEEVDQSDADSGAGGLLGFIDITIAGAVSALPLLDAPQDVALLRNTLNALIVSTNQLFAATTPLLRGPQDLSQLRSVANGLLRTIAVEGDVVLPDLTGPVDVSDLTNLINLLIVRVNSSA